ncbi:beta-glucanase (GH16 family) [Pseudaminobacter salicylatoxidans]|uniref:Beta-glucanase (GH16 family) n=1 Tax=Pseudaminobacter salicylatoxidans TaxID=93369 RepID=A0A316C5T4_PSESE|nr:family 16 glycosylhydrolase [Pseudaminobacter salicylatoxidans]PWJ82262.1 beta-glucanase (GH16 family) [Pseudaminobacter salicylatoxidans]
MDAVVNAKGVPLFYSGTSTNHISATGSGLKLYGTSANGTFWGDSNVRVTMHGGIGDDIYHLYSPINRVIEEPGEGIDTIVTWMSSTLPDNVENLIVTDTDRYAFGNALDNIIQGGAGHQTLDGGPGDDVLIGGGGPDTFIISKGNGSDLIVDFEAADTVRLNGYGLTSFEAVQARMTQVQSDVKLDLGSDEVLVFKDTALDQFTPGQFELPLDKSGMQLSFIDNFDTLSHWNGESGIWDSNFWWGQPNGSTLSSNSELQWYIDSDYGPTKKVNPFSVENGILTITAARATDDIKPFINDYEYTSGLLTTHKSFSQTYGYFEMRADLPEIGGTWPAFWLLPEDGSWPPELDVVEIRGQEPNRLFMTAHSNASGEHTTVSSTVNVSDTEGFHTYGVLWTEDEIVWYYDDVAVARADTPADMHDPMYMLVNLAVGGTAGAPADGLATPAEMHIDYIRAYTLDDVHNDALNAEHDWSV